jgi:hypothetical protein
MTVTGQVARPPQGGAPFWPEPDGTTPPVSLNPDAARDNSAAINSAEVMHAAGGVTPLVARSTGPGKPGDSFQPRSDQALSRQGSH